MLNTIFMKYPFQLALYCVLLFQVFPWYFSQHLQRVDSDGHTALHVCAQYQQSECLKLLLRVRPDLADIENLEGQTALDIAKEQNNDLCMELLNHAIAGKTELFENVNIDWNLIQVRFEARSARFMDGLSWNTVNTDNTVVWSSSETSQDASQTAGSPNKKASLITKEVKTSEKSKLVK